MLDTLAAPLRAAGLPMGSSWLSSVGNAVLAHIGNARNRTREGDQYILGGTHWDGFSHRQLFRMVHQRAHPAQVQQLADDWERHGKDLVERVEDLRRMLSQLAPRWEGQAVTSVLATATWMSEAAQTTQEMGRPMQDAAGALTVAQRTMPPPPGGGGWAALGGAGGGAAIGAALGGPPGAVIGFIAGGIGSMFGGFGARRKAKRLAVDTDAALDELMALIPR